MRVVAAFTLALAAALAVAPRALSAEAAGGAGGDTDRLTGTASCEHLRVFSLDFRNVKAKLAVEGPKWQLSEITGDLLGGKVFGRTKIDNTARPADIAIFVSVKGADIAPLARKHGLTDLKGRMEGGADLRWVGAEKTLTGALVLRIADGDLGAIPFGVKIFRFLGSPGIFGKRLTSADVAVRIVPEGIVVESIKIASPNDDVVMVVEEGGTIGFDGKLDLRIQPVIRSKVLAKIPIAGTITQAVLGFLQRRSMRVCVRGTISEPSMSWSPAN